MTPNVVMRPRDHVHLPETVIEPTLPLAWTMRLFTIAASLLIAHTAVPIWLLGLGFCFTCSTNGPRHHDFFMTCMLAPLGPDPSIATSYLVCFLAYYLHSLSYKVNRAPLGRCDTDTPTYGHGDSTITYDSAAHPVIPQVLLV